MDASALEAIAKEARRKADIAKHKPLSLETLDAYGDEQNRSICESQVDLFKLALQVQNAYVTELSSLWSVIRMLRAEALYWRQKCLDAEVISGTDKAT